MHTTRSHKGWVFLHNGDFSGNVQLRKIDPNTDEVEEKDNRHVEVEVPSEVLIHFAAEVVRSRRMSDLEQATPEQILDLPPRR